MSELTLKTNGHSATITLNRPELRNAFNEELIAQITQAFENLSTNKEVRVIVLAAEGKAFCAGADLNWMRRMADYSYEENCADATKLARMLQAIDHCEKPIIARVQGDVYAGGLGLVVCADIAVSVDSAGFCLSETKLGLLPATISPYVIRAMGQRAAQRYFLTAERFSAQEAQRLGLVHEVVRSEDLDAKVNDIAKALLACSPNAVKMCKKLVKEVSSQSIGQPLIDQTVQAIAQIRASDEGREGVSAFLNKRKPAWLA